MLNDWDHDVSFVSQGTTATLGTMCSGDLEGLAEPESALVWDLTGQTGSAMYMR